MNGKYLSVEYLWVVSDGDHVLVAAQKWVPIPLNNHQNKVQTFLKFLSVFLDQAVRLKKTH